MTRPDHFSGAYTLVPDNSYTVNGTTYRTDERGRIIGFDGPLSREAAPRSRSAQRHLPGKLPGEDAGHYMAASQGGSGRADNLGRMDHQVNVRDYRGMERENEALLHSGQEVTLHGTVTYGGEGTRPDCFMVTREVTDPVAGQTRTDYLSWTNTDMALFEGDDTWAALAEEFPSPGEGDCFGPEPGTAQPEGETPGSGVREHNGLSL